MTLTEQLDEIIRTLREARAELQESHAEYEKKQMALLKQMEQGRGL
jgi:hypothetical protein